MQISNNKKRLAGFLVPVLVGILVLAVLVKTRGKPEQVPAGERARAVRVIVAPAVDLVPRVIAHGSVTPGRVWEGVAEVSGKIVKMHPKLEAGEFLPADTPLLEIDPSDYELAVAQIESDIQAIRAQLAENRVKQENTQGSLAIEQQSLALGEKELKRKRKLVDKGTVSRSTVDQEERAVLAQRQSVNSLRNTLKLIPAERRLLEAQLARAEALLEGARLDLQRTAIGLPFDARISAVNVERSQSVRTGEVLIVADDIGVAEIDAQVPMQRLRNIVGAHRHSLQAMPAFEPGKALGVSARVRLPEFDIEWPARLARLSPTMDPKTRTLGVIVEVDEPYRQARPGVRPPLVKELFVEVELSGKARPDSLVIPRGALHEGRVYLAGPDDRLIVRPVQVGVMQPELVAINQGLEAGERVVVSDLVPAIEGMLLSPRPDQAALTRLVETAEGQTP